MSQHGNRPDPRPSALALDADIRDGVLELAVYPLGDTIRPMTRMAFDRDAVRARTRDLASALERATRRDPQSTAGRRALSRIGHSLFDLLIPPAAKARLAEHDGGLLYLNLTEHTVVLPWELLFDGERFLGERYASGRLVKAQVEAAPRTRQPACPWRALVIADPEGDLPSARAEAGRMRAVLSAEPDRCRAEAKCKPLTADWLTMHLREHDLVHFAGHADYRPDDPGASAWRLTDGPFRARQIAAMAGGKSAFPVLVFANACDTGQTADWLAAEHRGVFGLGSSFLMAGVRHYIGTVAPVLDEGAADLAAAFYDHLRSGRSVGEALRLARQACPTADGDCNTTGLSSLSYGDPAEVLFPAPEEGPPPTRPHCGLCGTVVLSQLSVGGTCEVCETPICRRCWALSGHHRCARHLPSQAPAPPTPARSGGATTAVECGRCGNTISDVGLAGGRCRQTGCDLPICVTCWRQGDDARWCRTHTRTRADLTQALRDDLAAGRIDRLVTCDEARQRELRFLGRVRLAVERIAAFTEPEAGLESPLTAKHVPAKGPSAPPEEGEPANESLRFALGGAEAVWAGGSGPVHLIARTLSNKDAQRRDGGDTRAADVADLNRLLAEAAALAERERCRILLLVGATAGWAAGARQAVRPTEPQDAYAHPAVAVVLFDLHDGAMVYNPADRRVAALAGLFELETDDERVARVAAYVRDRLLDQSALGLAQAAADCGVDESIAAAACERLAATGAYRIDELDDLGRVIVRPPDGVR